MKPGDRLVCTFVEPVTAGQQFGKWLLHITIVPWFRLEDDSAQIAYGLEQALQPIDPFTVTVGEEVRLGPQKNRPAHLLEPAGLPDIENRVRNYLHKKRAWLVDETTKKPRAFRPHVTFQGEEHLREGDEVLIDRLYIVEQKGDHKTVVAEVVLGEAAT